MTNNQTNLVSKPCQSRLIQISHEGARIDRWSRLPKLISRIVLIFVALAAGWIADRTARATENSVNVMVTIENLAPDNGTYLTPLWVGFHDGSFDSYDPDAAASAGLERIAEDGNPADLSQAFIDSGFAKMLSR